MDLGAVVAREDRGGGRGRAVLSRFGASALALFLVAAGTGCIYSPGGSCDSAADCRAGERCSAGVCVPASLSSGVDPTSFTTVLWSTVAGKSGTRFDVDSVGADPQSGDVVVAGAVSTPYDFGGGAVANGAFIAKRNGANGSHGWAASFPTFSHGKLATAVLPGGDVFFAGASPGQTKRGGTLTVGVLHASDGTALWTRTVEGTHATQDIIPVAASVKGNDLLMAGAGSADFGCGNTAADTFAVSLSAADGHCLWSRGLSTRTISDIEPRDSGDVAIAGLCTPSGAFFDPSAASTCTSGLFLAVLDGSTGSSLWARTTSGDGTVSAATDLAIAPDGRATVIGDATGTLSFGAGTIDFGAATRSFAATFDANGGISSVVLPDEEDPYASSPDALAFARCAYDRSGRLWITGRYTGQPTLGGIRFSACRSPSCRAAAFLSRLEADGKVSSFLPLRASPPDGSPDGSAFIDDLALFATTNTVALGLQFTGKVDVGGTTWNSAGTDLGLLRIVP